MNKPGPPDAHLTPEDAAPVPWWLVGCGLLGLVFFVVVGVVIFPILAALLFPPAPPRPPYLVETSHESHAYGFDDWTLTTTEPVCNVLADYQAADGTCTLQAGHCTAGARQDALAATCTGQVFFSRFAMRWEAKIYNRVSRTEVALSREIAWTR